MEIFKLYMSKNKQHKFLEAKEARERFKAVPVNKFA